jgi:ABC-2 type transport system ATP-binding protein
MVEVERLCERVIIMKKGEIVDDDTPGALLARFGRASLEQVFLDVARRGDDAGQVAP